jgi:hypothetical protein
MILLVTPASDAAERLQRAPDLEGTEVAATLAAARQLLARHSYRLVVLDQSLMEADPDGADRLFQAADTALQIVLNLAVTSAPRFLQQVLAAFKRQERETLTVGKVVRRELAAELKNTLTAFSLHCELLLDSAGLPPETRSRLETMQQLVGDMRDRLGG